MCEAQLRELVGAPYVSYHAEGAPTPAAAPDAAIVAPAWSAEWCKPRPGMLLAAMDAAGVPPHETLMVGFDYVDREAAHAAETNYIPHEHLLGRFDSERVGEHLVLAGEEQQATKAPGNFAQQKRRAAAQTPPKGPVR